MGQATGCHFRRILQRLNATIRVRIWLNDASRSRSASEACQGFRHLPLINVLAAAASLRRIAGSHAYAAETQRKAGSRALFRCETIASRHSSVCTLAIMNAGIGQTVRRKEDLRLVTGRGCYSDDFNLPGPGLWRRGALAACPCADPLDRRRRGARHARRARGADRRRTRCADGLKRIPHLAAPGTPPDIVLHQPRRLAGAGRAASRAADRSRPPRRHRGRLRHRRDRRAGQGRRRESGRRLRAAAGGDRRQGRGRDRTRRGSTTTCRIS